MNQLTQQGMSALKSGNKAEARRLLKQALQQDSKDIEAWLSLSSAVEGNADIAYCLNMALRLDPNNTTAREGMARFNQDVRARAAAQSVGVAQAVQAAEPEAQPDFRAELLHVPPFTTMDLEEVDTLAPPSGKPIAKPTPENQPPFSQSPALKDGSPAAKNKASGLKPWMWAALGGMALLILLALSAFTMLIFNASQPKQAVPPAHVPLVLPSRLRSSNPAGGLSSIGAPVIGKTIFPGSANIKPDDGFCVYINDCAVMRFLPSYSYSYLFEWRNTHERNVFQHPRPAA